MRDFKKQQWLLTWIMIDMRFLVGFCSLYSEIGVDYSDKHDLWRER